MLHLIGIFLIPYFGIQLYWWKDYLDWTPRKYLFGKNIDCFVFRVIFAATWTITYWLVNTPS